MTKFDRILIIGNAGSGKTWLGRALSQRTKFLLFHMDDIRWDKSGYNIRRSAVNIEKDLEVIKHQDTWILEGVFGKMAHRCLSYTELLLWLDLPWEGCRQNLLSRGPQYGGYLNLQEREEALRTLIEWASTHDTRNDANSFRFFSELYSQFKKDKLRFQSREEVHSFLNEFSL